MDFLHCNKCFDRKSPSGYMISSCFHTFCRNCVKSDLRRCQLCKKSVKIVRLDSNINSAIKMYFTDPAKYLNEEMEKLNKKIEFQTSIRIHIIKHLAKEKEKKRQMELYIRKKGSEFEAQKKELAEANSWILEAERRLEHGNEERIQLQRKVGELEIKLRDLQNPISTQLIPATPPNPFAFHTTMNTDQLARSYINSTPNSSFNIHSPFVNSITEPDYNFFLDNTTAAVGNGDSLFSATSSTTQQTLSDSAAFSNTFNNMFSSLKDGDTTTAPGRMTSNSLENWRADFSHDSRRETSLPMTSSHLSRIQPMDHDHIRELRRNSSQPGYLAHRKSIGKRINSQFDG